MNVIPLFRRIVFLKDGTVYELDNDQTGTPPADVFGTDMAEKMGLADATVYDMPDGRRVIAKPDKPASWRLWSSDPPSRIRRHLSGSGPSSRA